MTLKTGLALILVLSAGISKNTSITIYNQGIGVVNEERKLDLKKGANEIFIENVPTNIIPTSVFAEIPNAQIAEQNYRYDLASFATILNKFIGKEITLISDKDKPITGELISTNSQSVVIRLKDGQLFMIPDFNKYTINVGSLPKGLILRPTLQWNVISDKTANANLKLNYQTSGMDWNAQYVGVLSKDENMLDLNAWVSVNNQSGAAFENANVKLMAGEVYINKNVEFDEESSYKRKGNFESLSSNLSLVSEKEFMDFHLYTLDQEVTLMDKETKQVTLFKKNAIPVKKKYLVSNNTLSQNFESAAIAVEFKNDEKSNIGIPLPAGEFKINKNDGESTELVGEDRIGHKSKNDIITLNIGKAFDVKAKMIETNRKVFENGYTAEYTVNFKNSKPVDVELEFKNNFYLVNWEIDNATEKFTKPDSRTALFKIKIAKDAEAELKFKATVNYK